MIETPEAHLLCGQLNETVKGKTISYVLAQHTPHRHMWYCGTAEEYANLLTGRKIEEASPDGGLIGISVEDTMLVLGNSIHVRYLRRGEPLPEKHQLLIGFEDESSLVVITKIAGTVLCFPKKETNAPPAVYYEAITRLPQLMTKKFSLKYFLNLMKEECTDYKTVTAFLVTDRTIPGLGSATLQEILYRSNIHQRQRICDLTEDKKEELFKQIQEVLTEIYRKNGRNSELDLFGNRGEYVPKMSSKNVGKRCPRCRKMIRKETYMIGNFYYCPGCQILNNKEEEEE